MSRCVTDSIGMARWLTFTVSVVSALEYKEQIPKLQDRCSALDVSITRTFRIYQPPRRGASPGVLKMTIKRKIMWMPQPVVSRSKIKGTIDTVDIMEKDPESCQDVSSDSRQAFQDRKKGHTLLSSHHPKVDDYKTWPYHQQTQMKSLENGPRRSVVNTL